MMDATEERWARWLDEGHGRALGVAPCELPHHGFVIVGMAPVEQYPGVRFRIGRSEYPSADHAREAIERINIEAGIVCSNCHWWTPWEPDSAVDNPGGVCECPAVVHLRDHDQRVRLDFQPCLMPVGFLPKQS